MKMQLFLSFLVNAFALRRGRDYVIKPGLTLISFLSFYIAVSAAFGQIIPERLPYQLMIMAIVELPFMTLAFAVMYHQARLKVRLADLAMTDVLTGLPNRRAFFSAVKHKRSRGVPGFLLIIDADHFKRINDTYGHGVGDVCLQAISRRMVAIKNPHDLIGRIGGEEFGAYLPDATQTDLAEFGTRLCAVVAVRLSDLPDTLRLTVSAGAAEAIPNEPVETTMQRADEALYAAKANGRSQIVTWTKTLKDSVA
jgi:diguanylate cyclase (GGDEF)-like protein